MQQASYLEGGPLMWILPLYGHVDKKSDDDDDPVSHLLARYKCKSYHVVHFIVDPCISQLKHISNAKNIHQT